LKQVIRWSDTGAFTKEWLLYDSLNNEGFGLDPEAVSDLEPPNLPICDAHVPTLGADLSPFIFDEQKFPEALSRNQARAV